MKNKPIPRLFFFTGLGADERAFVHLNIRTPGQKVYVSWLTPGKSEPLPSYCHRLATHYGIHDGDVLIGLSFGGFVAVEINQFIRPALTILISSAATGKELPLLYRAAGRLGLDRLLPESLLNQPGSFKYFLFGLKKPEQRKLFDEIISGADVPFVRWAISRIVRWQNPKRPENLYKINGTADRILPLHKNTTDFIIPGGSHFLTWEKADEVSRIINKLLTEKGIAPEPLP